MEKLACLYIDEDYQRIIETNVPLEIHDNLYVHPTIRECWVTERQLSLLLYWLDFNKCKNKTFIKYLQMAGHNCFNW